MNCKELLSKTEPVFRLLYDSLLTEEEKRAIQGGGSCLDIDTGTPCICLYFRKTDPKADYWIQKWNNQVIDGIRIQAEKRGIAVAC